MNKNKIILLGGISTSLLAYSSKAPVEVAIIGFTITILASVICDLVEQKKTKN